MATAPQLPPAQPWDTRTQQELSLLFVAFPVLGEADHDPAPFIAIDLITRRPEDGRHVRAVHTGLFERMGGTTRFWREQVGRFAHSACLDGRQVPEHCRVPRLSPRAARISGVTGDSTRSDARIAISSSTLRAPCVSITTGGSVAGTVTAGYAAAGGHPVHAKVGCSTGLARHSTPSGPGPRRRCGRSVASAAWRNAVDQPALEP